MRVLSIIHIPGPAYALTSIPPSWLYLVTVTLSHPLLISTSLTTCSNCSGSLASNLLRTLSSSTGSNAGAFVSSEGRACADSSSSCSQLDAREAEMSCSDMLASAPQGISDG